MLRRLLNPVCVAADLRFSPFSYDKQGNATMKEDGNNHGGADTRPSSHRGKKLGRPNTRFDKLVAVPTRCPDQIYTYLKGISPFRYSSLTAMFEDMMTRFMTERPWERGLLWRKPKTALSFAGGKTGRTGWVQVNIQLTPATAARLTLEAERCGQSKACFCYTAMFWWVQYIFPPNKTVQ